MKNIITNIQRFCLQDGPGIRTVVFFKGCNLNCPWCSNPENISFDIETSVDREITYGKEYNCKDLYDEIIKDKIYYKNSGGVTFSGGEPLWHVFEIKELLEKIKREKISIVFETTLSIPREYVLESLKYADYYLVDIKILTDDAKDKINLDANLFLDNITYLLKNTSNVRFRLPLVRNYTYTEANLTAIYEFLIKNNIRDIDVFNVHELGKIKYEKLGKKINHFDTIDNKEIELLNKKFRYKH